MQWRENEHTDAARTWMAWGEGVATENTNHSLGCGSATRLPYHFLVVDEKRENDQSRRAQSVLGKNKWAAQENSGRKSRKIHAMVLIEQTGTDVRSGVFSLIPTTAQWLASGAAPYISPPYGPMSSLQSSAQLKPSSGGPEGWGPTHPTSNTVPPYSNPGIHSPASN